MGSPRVETAASWFENLGGSQIKGSAEYPFRLHVLVAGYRVTPRHSMFEGVREMGSALIEKIVKHEHLGLKKEAELLFVLPERWMSVHEQRCFIDRLATHPESSNIKSVNIVTQEALIVSGLSSKSIAIFQLMDGDPEAGLLDCEMQ